MSYTDVIKHLQGKHDQSSHGSGGVSAPRFHADSIDGRNPAKTVNKLGKFMADNKTRIEPATYTSLSKRGTKIFNDAKVSFRVNTRYNKGPGILNRKSLASDLNQLAADVEAAIK